MFGFTTSLPESQRITIILQKLHSVASIKSRWLAVILTNNCQSKHALREKNGWVHYKTGRGSTWGWHSPDMSLFNANYHAISYIHLSDALSHFFAFPAGSILLAWYCWKVTCSRIQYLPFSLHGQTCAGCRFPIINMKI